MAGVHRALLPAARSSRGANWRLVTRVSLAADTAAADWLVGHIRGFAESGLSLVPSGFDAYVRVFHPAYRQSGGGQLRPVRWAEIAASRGMRSHPGMQLRAITRTEDSSVALPGIYDHPPQMGTLPDQVARPLANVLRAQTSTPERCWFALWDGYGAVRGNTVGEAPRFHLPSRDYHLLVGPVEAVAESTLGPPWWQTPNLSWPDDHAWCLASEIDLDSTYVACDAAYRDAILAVPELKALPIDANDRDHPRQRHHQSVTRSLASPLRGGRAVGRMTPAHECIAADGGTTDRSAVMSRRRRRRLAPDRVSEGVRSGRDRQHARRSPPLDQPVMAFNEPIKRP